MLEIKKELVCYAHPVTNDDAIIAVINNGIGAMMNLYWALNDFISKELYAPFVLKNDADYMTDLRKKYKILHRQAFKAGADKESLAIISKFKTKILEALNSYYKADILKCNAIIRNLIKDVGYTHLAVCPLYDNCAFLGDNRSEIQFFRCRIGNPSYNYKAKDMLHLPASLRAKSGNYRFSIPGNPCLYLANSSYGCWIETGFPPENEFNVSPVIMDGSQNIFNLAVSIRDFHGLNDLEEKNVHCCLKLLMLMIATSYRIEEQGRTFKSEYIISQSIMMACKKLGYDGLAYYSKRVDDENFAKCAVNLALFVDYKGEYSEIVNHLKMDDSFNFGLFKQLHCSLARKDYELRCDRIGIANNIGNYDRQYSYHETWYFDFDKFLFYSWENKPNGKGKNDISWGVKID